MSPRRWPPGTRPAGPAGRSARARVLGPDELLERTLLAARTLGPRPTDATGTNPLYLDAAVGIWRTSWPAAAFGAFHDHQDSLGAVVVLDGELVEWRWHFPDDVAGNPRSTAEEAYAGGPGPRRRVLPVDEAVLFPPGHVHDLGCRDPGGALGVVSFSPPPAALRYWAYRGSTLHSPRIGPGAAPPRAA